MAGILTLRRYIAKFLIMNHAQTSFDSNFNKTEPAKRFFVFVLTSLLISFYFFYPPRFSDLSLSPDFMALRPIAGCSMAMVVFTNDAYLDHPFPFTSLSCPISHRFIFLRSGTAGDSWRTFTTDRDRNFTDGYIVRAGFNDSDLLGLALTLYFRASFALVVDFDRFERFDNKWIDCAAAQLHRGGAAAVAARVLDGTASHALLTHTRVLRRILAYTDVRYSDVPVIAMFSRWVGAVAELAGANVLRAVPPAPPGATIRAMQCPKNISSQSTDVAVIIPSFKRDYMDALISGFRRQTHPPTRVFFIQNRMHILLNFTRILATAGSIPISHVWCTNWNSFFFLTYVVVMFLPERFVIKIDDDQAPIDMTGIKRYIAIATNRDVIIGRDGVALGNRLCYIRPKLIPGRGVVDHVSWLVLFQTQAGKVMNRFQWYTLVHGEDVALSVANAMECGTENIIVQFNCTDYVDEKTSQLQDAEIRRNWPRARSDPYIASYCYILRGRYRPVLWTNFTVARSFDLRLPH
jgi:hypothetical protein